MGRPYSMISYSFARPKSTKCLAGTWLQFYSRVSESSKNEISNKFSHKISKSVRNGYKLKLEFVSNFFTSAEKFNIKTLKSGRLFGGFSK